MNPDTTNRDPRVDPHLGDILGFGRSRYYIVRLGDREPPKGWVYYTQRRPNFFPLTGHAYFMDIKAWRKGSKHPECIVHHVAENA